MLKIREEQMVSFQAVADKAFVKRVAKFLRAHHSNTRVTLPERITTIKRMEDETLTSLVHDGIARARTYGMTYESALVGFVLLMFEAAPNFDTHPAFQRFLKDEELQPNSRIDTLLEEATEEDWRLVQENYDFNAWNLKSES